MANGFDLRGRERRRQILRVKDEVIVPQRVIFPEFHVQTLNEQTIKQHEQKLLLGVQTSKQNQLRHWPAAFHLD
jgi:hypothetical protein